MASDNIKPGRGIDHLVLPVQDLDAAAEFYRALGFTTTPRAQHPFGTSNVLVQLQGNFLELLAVTEPAKIAEADPGHFSFGTYNRDFLTKREGLSMLVFESRDARADQAEFAAAGLETYPPFDFSRLAKLPEGGEVTVAFSLTFVTAPDAPEAVFFCCQQHAPEYFWKPAYQSHANGAELCSEVIMVAEDPPALAGLYAGLQGAIAVSDNDGDLSIATARGSVSVLTPETFRHRFPGALFATAPQGPFFAGYQITVPDVSPLEELLRDNAVAYQRYNDCIHIQPDDAHGVVIEFADHRNSN